MAATADPASRGAAGTPLLAASELDYPPFAVTDERGQADGFAVELMRAAVKAMGRDVQFAVAPWHRIKQDLAEGRIQALPLVARTAARDEVFDFSVPYLSMHGVIVVRKGDSRIRGSADLRDKAVLVMRDDIAEEYVRSRRLSDRLVTTATTAEALRRLAGGEQDAAVMQKLVAQNLIEALGLGGLELLDPPLDEYQTFSFAVREGDSDLLALLNEGLALTIADGTYDRLRGKWLVPLPAAPAMPLAPVVAAVLLALLLAWGLAYLWQRSLLRMVRLRTAELSAANARVAEGQALRESEERLRLAAQAAHFGTFDFHPQSRQLRVSPELKSIAGLPPDASVERVDDGILAFVHPADRERVAATVRAACDPDGSPLIEDAHRIVRPDGTVRWVRLAAKVLFVGEGDARRPGRIVGTLADITERREAEAKFRALVEQALAGIYIVQGDHVRYANPLFAAMFGYPSPDAVIDRIQVGALVAQADRERVRSNIRLRTSGAVQEMQYDFQALRRDGTIFTAEVHGRAFEYQGRPAVIGIIQDITGRRRAEQALRESEGTLRTLFANLPGVAYRCELCAPWRVTVISEAVLQVTGYPAAEFLRRDGRTWGELILPEDLPHVEAAVAGGVGERRSYEIEYRIAHANRGTCWVFEKGQAVYGEDGEPRWLDGVIVDVTERKQAEAALERKSEELQRSNAELEEFAYVASHDLKAPLRAVANLALVIDEDAAAGLDPENRDRLRLLRERVIGMDRLIDSLLGYARLGRTRRGRSAVPLAPFLKDLVDGLNIPPAFHVELEEPLPALTADPLELRQIFQNLIVNAVHHHDRDGGIVRIGARPEEGGWRLEVADDGPGILPSERQHVFRMFSTDGKRGRFGIGLAVARKLVLANGGRIEVTENRPRGALFRIVWPK